MRNSTYLVLTCLGDEVPEQAEQLRPIPPYISLYLPIPPYTALYLPIPPYTSLYVPVLATKCLSRPSSFSFSSKEIQ